MGNDDVRERHESGRFLDPPVSPDRPYNFTCVSLFVRSFVRLSVRPSVHWLRVFLRIASLVLPVF